MYESWENVCVLWRKVCREETCMCAVGKVSLGVRFRKQVAFFFPKKQYVNSRLRLLSVNNFVSERNTIHYAILQ